MKKLLILLFMLPLIATAQETGIKWTTGLSWEQVKAKAKKENKYILLDCYTTWCGPCKFMDKNIFINDTVGKYYNSQFISVKVQMDKTKKDDAIIQSWYNDAEAINKRYWVEVYPTYIFLSPEGAVVYKSTGAKSVNEFVSLGKLATKPGQIAKNTYDEYLSLMNGYNGGNKDYDRMPFMIEAAYKTGEKELGKKLLEEHTEYVKNLKPENRYTKESITMWSKFLLKSYGQRFRFFYDEGDIIDKVMGEKGYAQKIVDKTIKYEIVDSFFKMQKGESIINGVKVKNSDIMFQRLPVRADGKIVVNENEANWKQLEKMIRKKFNRNWAKRGVLTARVQWYQQLRNYNLYTKYTLKKYKQYPPQDIFKEASSINNFSWEAFRYATDKALLKKVVPLQMKAIKALDDHMDNSPGYVHLKFTFWDTYANLLYKVGRKKEAISWQQNACNLEPSNKEAREALEQMKKGERTYVKMGSIWE